MKGGPPWAAAGSESAANIAPANTRRAAFPQNDATRMVGIEIFLWPLERNRLPANNVIPLLDPNCLDVHKLADPFHGEFTPMA